MTKLIVTVGCIAALAIVSQAVNNDKLQGVWEGSVANSPCNTRIQFQVKNYIAYNTDKDGMDCEDGSGTFIGTYSLGGDYILINYAYQPPEANVPDSVLGQIDFKNDNEFTMTLSFDPEDDDIVVTYTKITDDSLDGVYKGIADGAEVVVQMVQGTYVSVVRDLDDNDAEAYLGIYDIIDNDSMNITYVFTPDDEFNGVVIPTIYSKNGNSLTLATDENPFLEFDFELTKQSVTELEGTWTGADSDGCIVIADFYSNIFRVFNVGCGDEDAIIGSFEFHDANTINVTIAFEDGDDGELIQMEYSLVGDTFTLQVPNEDGTNTIVFTKTEAPPSFAAVKVTLETTLDQFNATLFKQQLATDLDIDPSSIIILSVTEGSVIVDVGFTSDDDKEVSQIISDLKKLESIGGVTVSSVEFVAGEAAGIAQLSALALLAAALARFLF